MGSVRAGRYAVHGAIGRGGTATVHLGQLRGPFGFSRSVAIKRLHPELARDPAVVAAFVDEARIAACVRDVHVVATLDVIPHDGELFVVMDYVHGESLARLLSTCAARGERTPVPIALGIVGAVLRGLHAAHETRGADGAPLGIVHRDVSPQNVVVGSDGLPRVLDFGVAKARGRLQETREGQIKGKLGYMPPEQLCGEPLDRRADVYAAGVLLWETLVCERLFDGVDESALVERVLDGLVAPPSARVAGLAPGIDAVFARAVDPEPARRYATAKEMAQALAACGDAAPPSAIGAWVESLAAEELAARGRALEDAARDAPLFELASSRERAATTRRAPRAARWKQGALVGASLVALAAVGARLVLARAGAPTERAAQAAAEAPPASIALDPLAPAPADPPEPAPTGAAPSRARPRAQPARRDACKPPFSLDAEGHKRWKRECFP